MKQRLRIGKNEREILLTVGVGAITIGALLIPGLAMAISPFLKKGKAGKQNAKRSIKRLEEKDLVFLSGEKVKLTKRGRNLLKMIQAGDITFERPNKWDHIWRIVAYDIPDDDKHERDYFRAKLEELGFAPVQESLYAFPYDCIQEIAVYAQSLGIAPFVLYLTTDKLPRQNEYLKKFGLK